MIHATLQSAGQRRRLLKDFLEHEVFESAEFDLGEIHLQRANLGINRDVVNRAGTERIRGQFGNRVILKRERLVGMRHNRTLITGYHVFITTHANHQRTALARNHQHAWFLLTHAADGIRAGHLAERGLHRVFKIALVELTNQVHQDFSVRLALEDVPLISEVNLDGRVVLNDAVVHQRNAVPLDRVVAMGVSVHLGHAAVGRPAGVRNAHAAVKPALAFDQLLQDPDAADALGDLDSPGLVLHRHAGRVVAAILQALQALKKECGGWFLADVCNDAAHVRGAPDRSGRLPRASRGMPEWILSARPTDYDRILAQFFAQKSPRVSTIHCLTTVSIIPAHPQIQTLRRRRFERGHGRHPRTRRTMRAPLVPHYVAKLCRSYAIMLRSPLNHHVHASWFMCQSVAKLTRSCLHHGRSPPIGTSVSAGAQVARRSCNPSACTQSSSLAAPGTATSVNPTPGTCPSLAPMPRFAPPP